MIKMKIMSRTWVMGTIMTALVLGAAIRMLLSCQLCDASLYAPSVSMRFHLDKIGNTTAAIDSNVSSTDDEWNQARSENYNEDDAIGTQQSELQLSKLLQQQQQSELQQQQSTASGISITETTTPPPPTALSDDEALERLTYLGKNQSWSPRARIESCLDAEHRRPTLEWHFYSNSSMPSSNNFHLPKHNSTTNNTSSKRLLIVQYGGYGTYARLLDLTAPINKAYARRWKQDILIVQGCLVQTDREKELNCTPAEHRATHNKMQLIQFGLQLRPYYDYMLLLDADAMMYNFNVDVRSLLPPQFMVAANRVQFNKPGYNKIQTWKINIGVTLWNLQHEHLPQFADDWQMAAVNFLTNVHNSPGDQMIMHSVLKRNLTWQENVYSLTREFYYKKGTIIKHIKRENMNYQPGKTELGQRSNLIQKYTLQLCQRFPRDCQNLDNATTYTDR